VDAERPPSVVRTPDGSGREIYLDWEAATDDQGCLRHCPACGCRELFVRKNFPQITGFLFVLAAALVSIILFAYHLVIPAMVVLGLVAVIDAVIFLFAGKCLVCYRCRSEYRELPISPKQAGWDLSIGEKYRPVHQQDADADPAVAKVAAAGAGGANAVASGESSDDPEGGHEQNEQ